MGGMRGQACLPTLATVSSIFTMGAFFGTGEGFLDLVELLGYVLFELLSLMYVHCSVQYTVKNSILAYVNTPHSTIQYISIYAKIVNLSTRNKNETQQIYNFNW